MLMSSRVLSANPVTPPIMLGSLLPYMKPSRSHQRYNLINSICGVCVRLFTMPEVMVSACTGVMNSVIGKLTALLADEYKLIKGVKRGIRFLRDELSSMNAALQRLADMEDEQIDVQTKEWRNKVRELSYDIEDCIDRFMLRRSCGDSKANFVRKAVRKMKMLWNDRRIAKEIQELKADVNEESERRRRYNIDLCLASPHQYVLMDPRATTFYEEARDLVGIDGPRGEIIGWLMGEEKQLKVLSIFGIGGLGKTTLAMEVYHKTEEPFDCRASISVSRTLNIKQLLRDILFQVDKSKYGRSEGWELEQLISTLRQYLEDKRYVIVIDDIWSISAWEHLKYALPTNNNRSRIITTTRIKGVAKSCCTSIDGHIYEAKPLSEVDSQRLFFKRMFCSSEECPQELKKVANGILRKCGGLPLAIISISSLLANRSQTVEAWVKILNSISSTVEKDCPIDKMKRILFLSYYDLPHCLKTCLLYLSVFPEDYYISSKHLIWRWIAEGLIPGQNRESMELLGQSYLNELVNRSMIQAAKIGVDGTTVKFCKVHDVVFDFILSEAVDANFVTILNGSDFGNSSNKIRRLSAQSNSPETADMATKVNSASHLRSLSIFGYGIMNLSEQVPRLLSSQVMRLLNIERSWDFQDSHLEHIVNFGQLKYLRIAHTGISKIPEQIGNLQYLEILDVSRNSIGNLPSSIVQLKKLVQLFFPKEVQLPDEIGNLQNLEELSCIDPSRASAKSMHGLSQLAKLRVLVIFWDYYTDNAYDMEGNKKICVASLTKLVMRSLRSLYVWGIGDSDLINSCMVSCGSTTPLKRLSLRDFTLSTIPSGIGSLVNLTRLCISVRGEVGEHGLKTLASLPMLLSISLYLGNDGYVVHPVHAIGRQGFQRLVKMNFHCWCDDALKFEPGAMPKLQRLKLGVDARCWFKYQHGGPVLGLQHLSGLRHISVVIDCIGAVAEEVQELEDHIRGAAGTFPKRPILEVRRIHQEYMKKTVI